MSVLLNISVLVASAVSAQQPVLVSAHPVSLQAEHIILPSNWVREIDGCPRVGLSEVRCCVSGDNVNVVPMFWSVRSNNRLSRSMDSASAGFSVPSLLASLGGQEMGRWGGRAGFSVGLQMHSGVVKLHPRIVFC